MDDKKQQMGILEMITKAQIGIQWLFYTEVNGNSERKFRDVLKDYKARNDNISFFNEGTALLYGYISLVVPKETVFKKLNYSKVAISDFDVVKNTYKVKENGRKVDLVRHIRNSLAHGRYESEGGCFVFRDKDEESGAEFEARIEWSKFGTFVQNFYYVLKDQYFEQR